MRSRDLSSTCCLKTSQETLGPLMTEYVQKSDHRTIKRYVMSILIWFRNDFRMADNPALCNAIKLSTSGAHPRPILALTILSPEEDKSHDRSPNQVNFMLRNLQSLSQSLWDRFKIPMLVKTAESAEKVLNIIDEIMSRVEVTDAFFNMQYEVDEMARDQNVIEAARLKSIKIHKYHDQVMIPPEKLFKILPNGKRVGHTVYSPFRKAWMQYAETHPDILKLHIPSAFENSTELLNSKFGIQGPDAVPSSVKGFEVTDEMAAKLSDLYPAGEQKAEERLENFIQKKLFPYKKKRDFVDIESTSVISPYLAIGILSGRQCILAAQKRNQGHLDAGSDGACHWIKEVLWREFFKNVLYAYPRVCKNKPLVSESSLIKWRYDKKEFQAWLEGKTGYPLVDAAMREIKATGWLHNRTRMTVASFLTKDLLHDWRLGEKHFMNHLIDGDFASNSGGWQWASSVGTDSKPYVRIFNPYVQSKKFDPKGNYIRKWVPELRSIKDPNAIHDPFTFLGEKKILDIGYYVPIVNHKKATERAKKVFSVIF